MINNIIKLALPAIFLGVGLFACVSHRVSVTGIAKDDKGIATLISKEGQYFLKGVYRWEEKYLNKRVKVTGRLVIIKYSEDTLHPPNYSQKRKFDMNYLLKPKWRLVH